MKDTQYLHGTWYGVVAADGLALLPADAGLDAVRAVHDALVPSAGHAGLAAVLSALTQLAKGSISSIPAFAVVTTDGASTAVAVRGEPLVLVGDDQVSARGTHSWRETMVDDTPPVVLRVPGDPGPAEPLPIEAGIVRVAELRVGAVDAWAVDAGAGEVRAGGQPSVVDAPSAAPEAPARTPEHVDPNEADGIVDPAPPASVPSVAEATIAPGDPLPEPAEPAPADPEPVTPEPATSEPVAGTTTAGEDYAYLWDSTVHQSVESAAVRTVEETEGSAAAGSAPEQPVSLPPPPPPPSPSGTGPVPDGGPEKISMPAFAAAPQPPAPERLGDHDYLTVAVDEPPGAPVLASPPPASPPPSGLGPMVLGRDCTAGHLSPPHVETCHVCGLPLTGSAHLMPRPALGRLVLPEEDLVLDRGIVLGRKPVAARVSAASAPRLVTLRAEEISRSHLEIRLDDWSVLAVDLGSQNGTTLIRPGEPVRRLHAHAPVLLRTGDVLDIGGAAEISLDSLP